MWEYKKTNDYFIDTNDGGMVRLSEVVAVMKTTDDPACAIIHLRDGAEIRAHVSPEEFRERVKAALA